MIEFREKNIGVECTIERKLLSFNPKEKVHICGGCRNKLNEEYQVEIGTSGGLFPNF